MSSRNNRLSPEERQAAPMIYRALTEGVRAQKEGSSVSEVHDLVIREIEASPLLRVEYFSIVDRDTLERSASGARRSMPSVPSRSMTGRFA